jgi:light-regulated signal transduction histidine kinase (bacteriophytochrome)
MEREGQTVMIGVIQDVSDEIKAADNLRINNSKLIRSNIELESFSRVASHDLQEPLRKIQIFISRLDEEEKKKLSEKGKGYFEKIDNAAARMQSLIRNLLTYSQIDSSHEDFEKVDLNLVLEKALEDFSEYISDTKAKINTEKLPIIKGVSFQIKQLFDNLIANSLKYRNPKLDPQIQLKSEKVDYKQIPGEFLKSYNHYYKITYIDNGIGFEEEYTDKIFEMFQRLHQKNEYSGTGIGLAICKKIVENHHGHIYATSALGKGSAFIIYLPV